VEQAKNNTGNPRGEQDKEDSDDDDDDDDERSNVKYR
jgi:hypothetical protein